jgi:hypothetical protein
MMPKGVRNCAGVELLNVPPDTYRPSTNKTQRNIFLHAVDVDVSVVTYHKVARQSNPTSNRSQKGSQKGPKRGPK